MTTRREVLRLFGSASAAAWFAAMQTGVNFSIAPNAYPAAAAKDDDSTPPLAPGAPMSPERIALIEAFKKQSEGLEKKLGAHPQERLGNALPAVPAGCSRENAVAGVSARQRRVGRRQSEATGPGQYLWYTRLAASPEPEEFSLLRPGTADRPGMGSIRFVATDRGAAEGAFRFRRWVTVGPGDYRRLAP